MKKLLAILAIPAILATAGCATYKPIPENYSGPIATVADSGKSEDYSKAQIFALTEIDGNRIHDSFGASLMASHHQGPVLRLRLTDRQIPAKPVKVKIRASHATGAPIHELASRAVGTFFEVEGVVDFNPQPNGQYVVVGTLAKDASSVWIEDVATKKPVTEKVISK